MSVYCLSHGDNSHTAPHKIIYNFFIDSLLFIRMIFFKLRSTFVATPIFLLVGIVYSSVCSLTWLPDIDILDMMIFSDEYYLF